MFAWICNLPLPVDGADAPVRRDADVGGERADAGARQHRRVLHEDVEHFDSFIGSES